jgi:hypothetical protein
VVDAGLQVRFSWLRGRRCRARKSRNAPQVLVDSM